MDYNRIKISLDQAEKILLDLYRIEGTVSPLPGYVDFNFKIKTKKERFVLKISRPNENKKYLDYQQKLLQYIHQSDEKIMAPKVLFDQND